MCYFLCRKPSCKDVILRFESILIVRELFKDRISDVKGLKNFRLPRCSLKVYVGRVRHRQGFPLVMLGTGLRLGAI
jgi:hypothetical protein